MIGDDVFFSSAADLNRRLKAKEFSCVELTRAYCDRLETLGPKYNALALSLRKPALRKAKDIDGEIKRERFRGGLQGVPGLPFVVSLGQPMKNKREADDRIQLYLSRDSFHGIGTLLDASCMRPLQRAGATVSNIRCNGSAA